MARSKKRALRRRAAVAKPVRRFYLVTEGLNTEPSYFSSVRDFLGKTQIEIVIEPGAGDPRKIANRAKEIQNTYGLSKKTDRTLPSFEENDEVWVIFDRDSHKHYADAKKTCNANGIGVAYSDPCFELWLIFHFCDHDCPCSSEEAQNRCQELLAGYDPKKRKTADFFSILAELEAAETRAERQQKARTNEGSVEGNPSTSVYRLTRRMRLAAKASTI